MKQPANAGETAAETPILVPGFGAGLVGGIVMAAWMTGSAAVNGMEPLAPLSPIADTFKESEASARGAAALVYALILHMLFSGVVGVVMTALLPFRLEARFASFICVGFAFAIMAIMTSFVLPAYNPSLRDEMPELGGSWVIAHAAYGATVGFLAQRLRQRSRAAAPRPRAEPPREQAPVDAEPSVGTARR